MPTIKGENVKCTITKEGSPLGIFNVVSATFNDDAEVVKRNYLGEKRPKISRVENGYSGTITMEIEDGDLEDALKEQIALADNNEDTDVFGIQIQESYPSGEVKTYAFRSACIKLNRSMSGRMDAITKELSFTASDYEQV